MLLQGGALAAWRWLARSRSRQTCRVQSAPLRTRGEQDRKAVAVYASPRLAVLFLAESRDWAHALLAR